MRWWPPLFRRAEPFGFREPGILVDGELSLVEPAAVWIEPILAIARDPRSSHDPIGRTTREEMLRFLDRFPRGRESPNPYRNRAASYTFWMHLRRRSTDPPDAPQIGGTVSLRIGETEDLRRYLGHVGYGVHPPARGRHLAERAVRLLLPLARSHGLRELWITANPENAASRRTCERLGGELVDVVDLPIGHPLFLRGDRRKCRYRFDLSHITPSLSAANALKY